MKKLGMRLRTLKKLNKIRLMYIDEVEKARAEAREEGHREGWEDASKWFGDRLDEADKKLKQTVKDMEHLPSSSVVRRLCDQSGIGMPDHKLGYKVKTLRDRLSKDRFQELQKWMTGQTVALDKETGDHVYYTWDVQRFFNIAPGKEIFD